MRTTLLAVVVVVVAAVSVHGVQVDLKQGVFKGETLDAGDGRLVFSFRGIPYAKPPVGDLRLMDPEPAEAWSGTKESFTPPQCPQINFESFFNGDPELSGEEDCLYLHVYTAQLCGAKLLPVMVFMHGGGFLLGNPDVAGGTALPLLTKDVVLVSMQYRLGTLGFLSTGDNLLPGNMGLKDQTLALQWVRDNIRSFGGDPDSVTIFGESAGGASVHYQMLTPASEGLFHRVIMQSGNALCPWALRSDHKRVAAGVARQLGCSGVETAEGSLDSQALLSCLQAAPVADLVFAANQGESWNNFPFYMVPRVDGDYLPAHPATLLREGRYHKLDVMAGVCQHEGVSMALGTMSPGAGEKMVVDFPKLGPLSLGTDQEDRAFSLARRIHYYYLGPGNLTFNEQNVEELIQMYGDAFFMVPHELTSQFLARDASFGRNVYMYQLQHRGANSLSSIMPLNLTLEMKWVSHGDDLQYLFTDIFGSKPVTRPDDVFLSEIMVDLWTTFAATGNPTPDLSLGFQWAPASPSSLHYLSLKPAATMQPDTRAEVRAFFTDLPTKLNQLLFPEKFAAKTVRPSSESGHCHV